MTEANPFDEAAEWLRRMDAVRSAVAFGSSYAWRENAFRLADFSHDLDLHLIISQSSDFFRAALKGLLSSQEFVFQANKAASGGVDKVTLIFSSAQFDLVLVPLSFMRLAEIGLRFRLHTRMRALRRALDEMCTCLRSGYSFVKGERRWQEFYRRVSELGGVRLNDMEVHNLASTAVCDLLWSFQKVRDGELVAAQHAIHSRLSETNLRLWREMRLRRELPLPSFGLGRRFEFLATEREKSLLSVNARLSPRDVCAAGWRCFNALQVIMHELCPLWHVPQAMRERIEEYYSYITGDRAPDA